MSRIPAGTRARRIALLVAAAALAPVAEALEVFHGNNTGNANLGTTWVGGAAPGSGDVAVWNSTVTSANTTSLGADLSWQGIKILNPTGLVTLGASATNTLTLGSSGIDMSAATSNLTILSNLTASVAQTWTVKGGQALQIQNINTNTRLSGSGDITLARAGTTGTANFNFNPGANLSTAFTDQFGFYNYTGNWTIGSGVLVKTLRNGRNAWGSGTITLAGGTVGQWNNFSGAWTNSIVLSAGTASIIDDFNTSGSRYLQLNGVISGTGSLTFQDTNASVTTSRDITFVLAATNTMSGTVTIASGSFLRVGGLGGNNNTGSGGVPSAGGAGTLGTASVVVTGGLAFTRTDAWSVANTLSGAGTVYVGSDHANLTGTGTQVLTLSGANSYSGGTEVLKGSLSISDLSNIGTGYLAVKNGALFSYSGGTASTTRNLFLNSGKATINVTDANAVLTWTDASAKGGAAGDLFTKGGAGTLVLGGGIASGGATAVTVSAGTLRLEGANTYVGATTIAAGAALEVSGGGTLSATTPIALAGALSVSSSSSQTLGGAITGVGSLAKSGAGTLTLSATGNTFSGGTTISGGTLALGADGVLSDVGAVTVSGGSLSLLTFSETVGALSITSGSVSGSSGVLTTSGITANVASGAATLDALTAGAGALTKSGGGTLSLLKAASHSGGTVISDGVLSLGAANVLGDADAVAVSGGTLAIGAHSDTIGSLAISSGSVTGSSGVLSSGSTVAVTNTTGTVTLSAVLGGSAGLTKSGNGELLLSGANTYAGGTAVNAGTLSVTGAIGATTVAGTARLRGTGTVGALSLANGSFVDAGLSGLGSLTVGDITVDAAAQSTLSVLNVGNYVSSAAISAGFISLGAGGSLQFNVAGSAGIGSYALLSYAGTVNEGDFTLSYSGLSSRSSAELDFSTAGIIRYVVNGNQPKWRGTSSGWADVDAWVLTPSGAFTSYQSADAVIFDDSAASGSVTLGSDVDPASLVFSADTLDYTVVSSGGVITSGSLAKTGAALLTLGGANTYSGGSALSAGRTRVSHDSALGTGTITLGAAALSSDGVAARTLANNVLLTGNATLGDATDSGALTLSGAVDLGGAARTLTVASAATLGGAISNGALTKLGNATLTLSGANTYTGGTTVAAGTLVLGASNVLADTGAVSLAAGTTLDATGRTETLGALDIDNATVTGGTLTASAVTANAGTISSVLAGSGSLTKSGNGTLILSASNTYTGGTTLAAGTLQLGQATDTLANTGALTISGGTLDLGANSDTVGALTFTSGAITGAGTLTTAGAAFDIASGTTTLSTVLGGTTLTKAGAGTLVLTGANTYTSGTTVRAGTLRVSGNSALGSAGTVTLNDALTGSSDTAVLIDASVADGTVARAISVANQGTGSVTLGAHANRAGGFVTFSGVITLAKDVTLTGGAVEGDRTQFTGGISGSGNVTVAGTTRVMLVGAANTYAGGTTLAANAILQLGDGSASGLSLLPDASVVTLNAGSALRLAKGGNSETIGGLSGSGAVTAISGSDTLVISNAGADQSFAGTFASAAGTLNLTKQGAARQTFSGGISAGAVILNAGTLGLGANSTIQSLANAASETSANLDFGSNTLVIRGDVGKFYYGKLTGTGTLQLRGGSASIQNSDGTASASSNFQIWSAVTAAVQPAASQFFALDTGASETDRKDFAYINDSGNALNLSALSGFGAIRNDASGSGIVTRQIVVDQSGGDTVFSGALLSHKTAATTRQVALTKRGTSTLTLAGFIGKQTASATAGSSFVNLTVEDGVLNVTSEKNTTTVNTDAISLGNITITGGTLSFSSQALRNTAGTAGANSILLNGGTLRWNAGNTQDITAGGKLTLVAGKDGRLDVGANEVTLANAFAGGAIAASLTKLGNGALALSAANTYTGGTTLAAGSLRVGNDAALGAGALALNGGTLSSDGATARALGNAVSLGGDVTLGNVTRNGALTLSGAVDLGGATRTLTVASAATLSGVVSNGGLTKAGNGTLTLSAANTHTGGTTVNAGTLILGASERLDDTGALTVNAGTLDLGGNTETVGAFTLAGGSVANGTLAASSLTLQSGTVGAVLAGASALDKTTSGIVTLSADSSAYTGSVSVTAGTLSVTGNLAGSTLGLSAGSVLRGTGTAGIVTAAAGSQIQAGIGGVGSLALAGLTVGDGVAAALAITDVTNYGTAAALDVGTLSLGAGSSLAITLGGSYAAGTYKLLGYSGATLAAGDISVTPSGISSRFTASLDLSNAGQVLYTLEGSRVHWVGSVAQWSAADNWTAMSEGSWGPTSFLALDEVVFDDDATGTDVEVDTAVTPLGVAFENSAKSFTLTGAGGIQGGTFRKSGAGSVTIGNANAFSAATIEGGTVVLGDDAALGASQIALSGGTLALNGRSIANAIVLGGGAISGEGAIAGVLSGSGSLAKSSAGTLTLTAANTYTGGTTVSAGVLVLGHATDTLADAGSVAVTGGELALGANSDTIGALAVAGGTLSGTGTLTASSVVATNAGSAAISAALAGSGALSKSGAGVLTLTGANTYTGGTTITGGVLSFANGALGPSGNVSVNGGALRWASGNTQDISARLVMTAAGNATLDTNGNDVALASAIGSSSNSALTKSGNGKLTLAAAATYTGATTVNAGTLEIGNGGAAGSIGGSGSSLVSVASGATLLFNRSGTVDYKNTVRMRNVAGAGDIVLSGGLKLFNYTGTGAGFDEAGSWSGFSGRLVVLGGSEFQTIRNGRTAMGSAQVVLGDATTSGILSQIEGNWTWTNGINLVGAANTLRNNSTGTDRYLKLQGVLSGAGNVTLADAGGGFTNSARGFILTGTNTLTGQVTVDTFVRVGGVGGDDTTLGAGTAGDLGSASVVINSGKVLTFSRTDAASFANTLGGAGTVRIGSTAIAGSSTQDITLTGANTYTGGTEVLQGTLRVAALSGLANGALAVRGGSAFVYTGSGAETTAASLALDNGNATLGVADADAVLTWNDAATKGGANGGLITKTGNGTLVLGGAITAGGATAVRVSGGTLGLAGTSTYLGATTVDAGATLDVSGSLAAGTAITLGGTLRLSGASDQALSGGITGGGALLKTGAGLLTLASDNSSFTGSISVGDGTLLLGHLSGLGGSTVSVGNGATLNLASYGVANDLSINGGALLNYENWTGGIVVDSAGAGAAETEALLTLYGRSSTTVLAGGSLAIGGMTKAVVVDGGSLAGDLSTYTGELTVRSAVSFASSSAGGKVVLDGGSVDFGDRSAGGEIHYRGGSLTGAGNFSGDLVVDAPSVSLAAGTLGGARVVVGAGSAVSIGTGVTNEIRLSGGSLVGDTLNNLSGTLTVAAGLTFDLDGADDTLAIANGSADIALESGAKLKGTGTVGDVTLQTGASLAPGNSPGLITAQSLVLGAGAYDFEVAHLTNFFGDGPATAGTDYDSVTVVGELDLSNLSVSSRLVLNLISLGEDGLVGTPSVWDLGSPFELRLFGYGSLDLGSNSDIGALFLVNTSQFLNADQTPVDARCFTVINDELNFEIRLAYSAIPEPSTYGMVLGGLALAAAAYRRKRLKAKA